MSEIFSKIVESNSKREEKTLSQFATPNKEGLRLHPKLEKVPDKVNIRPPFFHDSDKIIHSLAYSRYVDKTQVFSFFENDHITHRALHVQFVSRIGRVLGRALNLNEDLIEAISIGHDIGHPPFGHDGERILNKICIDNKIGYFAHNAQSVRSLMELDNRGEGMNLTLQVLDGILCHNGEMVESEYHPNSNKNWDSFLKEYKNCFTQNHYTKDLIPMTMEGCVVRISDVISYIGRDIEDAIRVRLIKRADIPPNVTAILGDSNDLIINNLVNNLLENSYQKGHLSFSPEIYKALIELKNYNIKHIYNAPVIKTEHPKIRNIFHQLYYRYIEELEGDRKISDLFDHYLSGMKPIYFEKNDKKRIAIDFMAGMTDDFLVNQFKALFLPSEYGYSLDN